MLYVAIIALIFSVLYTELYKKFSGKLNNSHTKKKKWYADIFLDIVNLNYRMTTDYIKDYTELKGLIKIYGNIEPLDNTAQSSIELANSMRLYDTLTPHVISTLEKFRKYDTAEMISFVENNYETLVVEFRSSFENYVESTENLLSGELPPLERDTKDEHTDNQLNPNTVAIYTVQLAVIVMAIIEGMAWSLVICTIVFVVLVDVLIWYKLKKIGTQHREAMEYIMALKYKNIHSVFGSLIDLDKAMSQTRVDLPNKDALTERIGDWVLAARDNRFFNSISEIEEFNVDYPKVQELARKLEILIRSDVPKNNPLYINLATDLLRELKSELPTLKKTILVK